VGESSRKSAATPAQSRGSHSAAAARLRSPSRARSRPGRSARDGQREPSGQLSVRHGTVKRVRQHLEYTPGQLAKITAHLGRDGILAQVMHRTGCRISEALALRGDDFAGPPGKYRVKVQPQRERVTGADTDLKIAEKARTVPVSDAVYKDVRTHALRHGAGGVDSRPVPTAGLRARHTIC
jgi:integrase